MTFRYKCPIPPNDAARIIGAQGAYLESPSSSGGKFWLTLGVQLDCGHSVGFRQWGRLPWSPHARGQHKPLLPYRATDEMNVMQAKLNSTYIQEAVWVSSDAGTLAPESPHPGQLQSIDPNTLDLAWLIPHLPSRWTQPRTFVDVDATHASNLMAELHQVLLVIDTSDPVTLLVKKMMLEDALNNLRNPDPQLLSQMQLVVNAINMRAAAYLHG